MWPPCLSGFFAGASGRGAESKVRYHQGNFYTHTQSSVCRAVSSDGYLCMAVCGEKMINTARRRFAECVFEMERRELRTPLGALTDARSLKEINRPPFIVGPPPFVFLPKQEQRSALIKIQFAGTATHPRRRCIYFGRPPRKRVD